MSVRGDALLLLIDLQRSFCDADGAIASQGRDIGALQAAARRCDALAAAARASNCAIAWTRMAFRPDYADGGELLRIRPNLREIGALRRGSGDEAFSRLVRVEAEDFVIDKPRFSAVYATALEAVLRSGNRRRVIVAGVTTSMCVESTVRDLGQRDYETFVVEDACGDFEPARHEAALASMAFGFATPVSAEQAGRLLEEAGRG